jgi:hypothetical protein
MTAEQVTPASGQGARAGGSEQEREREREQAGERQRARRRDLGRAQVLARWTDSRMLDPLVGFLLPGAGDLLGVLAGLYIVGLARRHEAPAGVVARMLLNLTLDCLVGVVPVLGDIADVFSRANIRNAGLLERHLALAEADAGDKALESSASSGGLAIAVVVLVAVALVSVSATYVLLAAWRR